jgi:predicted kinase
MYVEEHPLALNMDIDRVRSLIGGWRGEPRAAGLLAREIALTAARVHLMAGHDVIVPQFLGRPAFLEQLEDLARQAGAAFHEIVLLDSKENALRRFADRASRGADPGDLAAWGMVDQASGIEELSAMYDRLMSVIAARPAAKVVATVAGQADAAYRDVLDSLS